MKEELAKAGLALILISILVAAGIVGSVFFPMRENNTIPVTPVTPEELQNEAWATNKASNTKFGVICESPASTYSSCYSFTGFYASVSEGGIVTLIDEDHKVFHFANMGCIIAPADEIGNDACVLTDGFLEEFEQE